jgi:hypothetical protein
MKFVKAHANGFIALGLFLATFLALFLHGPRVGFTRDEGYYFVASEHYAGWFRTLGKEPSKALTEKGIRRHFEINREHPVLVKNMMALSFLAFNPERARWNQAEGFRGLGSYSRVMRLPAHLISALGVALLFLFGCSLASRRVGLFAALAFILAGRHFYHAHLACFDMPVTVAWLATVMAYRKAQGSFAWGVATGAIWGLAIAVKHNAFFLPVLFVLHWLITQGGQFSLSRKGFKFPRIPVAFFSMLVLGPLIFIGHWPFLWNSTFERIGWYFNFHLQHVHYPWEYFGTLLTEAPFPWLYPFTVTALTLPLPTLLLGATGFFGVLGERLGHPFRAAARWLGRLAGWRAGSQPELERKPWLDKSDGWLVWLNAFIPIFVVAIPSVPIFGGMKHWLNAMPFVCLLAALALDRFVVMLPDLGVRFLRRAYVYAALAVLALLPSLLGLIHIGPYGTSFYNSLAGGASGAADLGMQRQYWSNNATGVLPWVNKNVPPGKRLYLHEVNGECFRTYQRDGYLRNDIKMSWMPEHADYTAYQYHREFTGIEYSLWQENRSRKTESGLYIDEVPIVLVYRKRL